MSDRATSSSNPSVVLGYDCCSRRHSLFNATVMCWRLDPSRRSLAWTAARGTWRRIIAASAGGSAPLRH